MTVTVQAACPECASELTLGTGVELNQIVECGDCRAELEIVSVEPLVIALAPEIDEDWGE